MTGQQQVSTPVYHLFGLTVQSDRPIAHLATDQSGRRPDVWVNFDAVDLQQQDHQWQDVPPALHRHRARIAVAQSSGVLRVIFRLRNSRTSLLYDKNARRIEITPGPAMSAADVDSFFLGTVTGFLLRRRGTNCLHASVVELAGRTVLFVGRKGAGKSTVAAALVRKFGARLIADDIAALMGEAGHISVYPGYPAHRLNRDVVATLTTTPAIDLPAVYSHDPEKRYLWNDKAANTRIPGPVVAIFDLEGIGPTNHQPMPTPQALHCLLQHSYASYGVLSRSEMAAEMQCFSALAQQAPVISVKRPTDLEHLGEFSRQLHELVAAI